MGRKYFIENATIVTGKAAFRGNIYISEGIISEIWKTEGEEAEQKLQDYKVFRSKEIDTSSDTITIDASGKLLMAGGIDAHVHFREPGMTAKADLHSESRAAVIGGVTSFIDMPNTVPPATSLERIEDKCHLAAGSIANFGFHIGADNTNPALLEEYLKQGSGDRFAGIKVFMGSSTGNMLVDRGQALEKLFSIQGARILIHSEDEQIIRANIAEAKSRYGENIPMRMHPLIRSRQACIRNTAKALEMAMRLGTRLHVLHVTTAEEIEMIHTAKGYNPEITAETSANYLWFCDEDYDRLGPLVKCNPAIKSPSDREALRKALKDGIIDTIGSDHAPHLRSEKDRPYLSCPSGMPSIEQTLAVLLTVCRQENIPYTRLSSVFSERAAEMFGIRDRGHVAKGKAADIVIIDPEQECTVGKTDKGCGRIDYKCGWSPYEGETLRGNVEDVFVGGVQVVSKGLPLFGNDICASGRRLVFSK